MRSLFPERGDALAALACARLSAGGAPPLDWIAAAIEQGRLLDPPRRRSARRMARLRRLGLTAAQVS